MRKLTVISTRLARQIFYLALVLTFTKAGLGQSSSFILPGNLPPEFVVAWQKLGIRMTNSGNASVMLTGTLTDQAGSRTVQMTVQTPGYLRFQDFSSSRVLTFNGSQFQSNNTGSAAEDQMVKESLMANLPDMIFLQVANGGGLRRIGGGFRTDDGKTPNYTGPFWFLYTFSPLNRSGLTRGQPLQQEIFIAVDQQTGLLAEVRIVTNAGTPSQTVTQTQFNNWFQFGNQSFPGQIVRLENGKQVLSFQTSPDQTLVQQQLPLSTFTP